MLTLLIFLLSFAFWQEPAVAPPQTPAATTPSELCVTHVESLHYPPLALQTRAAGEVKLSAMVDENGSIILPVVESGPQLLAEAAIRNLRTWKFRPPAGGAVTIEVTYQFALRDQPGPSTDEQIFFDLPLHVRILASAPEIQTTTSK